VYAFCGPSKPLSAANRKNVDEGELIWKEGILAEDPIEEEESLLGAA
jgi:hypothetical protein